MKPAVPKTDASIPDEPGSRPANASVIRLGNKALEHSMCIYTRSKTGNPSVLLQLWLDTATGTRMPNRRSKLDSKALEYHNAYTPKNHLDKRRRLAFPRFLYDRMPSRLVTVYRRREEGGLGVDVYTYCTAGKQRVPRNSDSTNTTNSDWARHWRNIQMHKSERRSEQDPNGW